MAERGIAILTGGGRRVLRNLLWLLCLGALATGVRGFWEAQAVCGPPGWPAFLDSLYRTLQTFGLNFDLPTCGPDPAAPAAPAPEPVMNGWIQGSRFLAFAAAFHAVLSVFFAGFLGDLRRHGQILFRAKHRHVLLGFGEVNRAVATALRREGRSTPITAVDRSFDAVDRRMARELGIVLLPGELSDANTLRRAGLHRAARVVVAVGDDIRAIEVARAAAPLVEAGLRRRCKSPDAMSRPAGQEETGDCVLRVHIVDPALLANLTDARDLANRRESDFQPFNLKVEAATRFVYAADLVQRARDHGQGRVHLVLVGLGHQGEAILLETLMTAYAFDLKPPKVTVLDRAAGAVEARMRAIYPRLMEDRLATMHEEGGPECEGWEPVTFTPLDVETTDFTCDGTLDALDMAEGGDAPTAWVFCCGEDRLNQSAALRLEVAMQQRARRAVPIFVRLWGSGLETATGQPRDLFGLIRTFGNAVETVSAAPGFHADGDHLARRIHQAYQEMGQPASAAAEAQPDRGSYRQAWLDLPEAMRATNRRPARHMAFKLRELGFDWPELRQGCRPAIPKAEADRLLALIAGISDAAGGGTDPQAFAADAQVLRDAALVEHSVWAVQRAAAGWSQAETRANSRRLQVFMKPFLQIAPDTQRYDLAALRAGLTVPAERTAPMAHLRLAANLILADVTPARLAGRTEVAVTVDAAGLRGCDVGTVRQALAAWSGEPQASRLHVLLAEPVLLPPERPRDHSEAVPIRQLSELLRELPDRIVVDVTRRYGPMPVPRKLAGG